MKVTKTDSGNQWMVKKGYRILYIGSKEEMRDIHGEHAVDVKLLNNTHYESFQIIR